MPRESIRSLLVPLLVGVGLAGCGATDVRDEARSDLTFAMAHRGDQTQSLEILSRMNRVLTDTRANTPGAELQRFYAAFVLADLHTNASLGTPFLREVTTMRTRGIGEREDAASRGWRPSRVAHLVASLYHSGRARGLQRMAEAAGAEEEGIRLLPAGLESLGLRSAEVNLGVFITVGYARLGFRTEVAAILDRTPELLQLESCLALFESNQVPAQLRPWVCELMSYHLRTSNELEAYRFAVVAIEGRERFGYALPSGVVSRLERWILLEASVAFVCPESGTEYLSGQRRSPISGISHLEYVAAPRQ